VTAAVSRQDHQQNYVMMTLTIICVD